MILKQRPFISVFLLLISLSLFNTIQTQASELPSGFIDEGMLGGLPEPAAFHFSPDGRLFIGERITGRLRVATYDAGTDSWRLLAQPFHTFDIPKDSSGNPESQRSGGLRDFTFDPNFATNGYIYAFYMTNNSRHNRVVRIQASTANPNVATLNSEMLLMQLPYNNSESSGSHNGGALIFGNDDKLYISTGDGWDGGDNVQSLSTFTGKILRLNSNGSIPADNPFYNQASGNYRAIYALGLRNPFSMSRHPDTNQIYVNDANGADKANILILEAGANYGHQGTGIGNTRGAWANAADAGGELLTGGVWYPNNGPFPAQYHGAYFTALWGGNRAPTGDLAIVASRTNTAVSIFADEVAEVGQGGEDIKPVMTQIGPDGNLYYMLTTYQTNSGAIHRIRQLDPNTVVPPAFNPSGGLFENPITVSMNSATANATIHYTLDGTLPTTSSARYSDPISISQTAVVQARAFRAGLNHSPVTSRQFVITNGSGNVPPVSEAGANQVTFFSNENITLNGSDSYDPDGDELLLSWKWEQISGPTVTLDGDDDAVTFFRAPAAGVYTFQLSVFDDEGFGTDNVTITVFPQPRNNDGIEAYYRFNEGSGTAVIDQSGSSVPLNLNIANPNSTSWEPGALALNSGTALRTSGAATSIINACRNSNEITVEVWLVPDSGSQSGPARIVSISDGTLNRNVTLAQAGSNFEVRLRTTATDNNGDPVFATNNNPVTTNLTQVVFTRQTNGTATIYVNGENVRSGNIGGNFSNWDTSYPLLLGNESTSNRPWLGELSTVAIYCEALTAAEVATNYSAKEFTALLNSYLPIILP